MTEKELREKILIKLLDYYDGCPLSDTLKLYKDILALIKEAGWKSEEEISRHERERLELLLSFIPENYPMPLGFGKFVNDNFWDLIDKYPPPHGR